jgi:hypothetical protein
MKLAKIEKRGRPVWGGGAQGNWKSEQRILEAALLTDSGSWRLSARLC